MINRGMMNSNEPTNYQPDTLPEAPPQHEGEFIKLDQFLKLAKVVQSGGEAKHLIKAGFVLVNGEEESRRGRKLYHGDEVDVEGEKYIVQVSD